MKTTLEAVQGPIRATVRSRSAVGLDEGASFGDFEKTFTASRSKMRAIDSQPLKLWIADLTLQP